VTVEPHKLAVLIDLWSIRDGYIGAESQVAFALIPVPPNLFHVYVEVSTRFAYVGQLDLLPFNSCWCDRILGIYCKSYTTLFLELLYFQYCPFVNVESVRENFLEVFERLG
jgi:hypothetical protein